MTGGLTGSRDAVRAEERAARLPSDREIATGRRDPFVRNNAPVPLEPELEHQVLAIAAHTGVSRAEVIQEMVRDRLKGGTFRPPFPFPVKHPAAGEGAQTGGRNDTTSPSTQRTA
jgi:hypothetical protein